MTYVARSRDTALIGLKTCSQLVAVYRSRPCSHVWLKEKIGSVVAMHHYHTLRTSSLFPLRSTTVIGHYQIMFDLNSQIIACKSEQEGWRAAKTLGSIHKTVCKGQLIVSGDSDRVHWVAGMAKLQRLCCGSPRLQSHDAALHGFLRRLRNVLRYYMVERRLPDQRLPMATLHYT